MSIAYVPACTAGADSASAGTVAVSLAAAPVAGDLIVASVGGFRVTAPTITSIADNRNAGNYSSAISSVALSTNNVRQAIYYKENISIVTTPYTITCTWGTSAAASITANVIRGAKQSSSQSGTNVGNATSTSPNSGSITPTAKAIYIGQVCYDGSATTITPDTGSGWTQGAEQDESDSHQSQNVEYQVASGALAATWTLGASRAWCALIAGFLEAPVDYLYSLLLRFN